MVVLVPVTGLTSARSTQITLRSSGMKIFSTMRTGHACAHTHNTNTIHPREQTDCWVLHAVSIILSVVTGVEGYVAGDEP